MSKQLLKTLASSARNLRNAANAAEKAGKQIMAGKSSDAVLKARDAGGKHTRSAIDAVNAATNSLNLLATSARDALVKKETAKLTAKPKVSKSVVKASKVVKKTQKKVVKAVKSLDKAKATLTKAHVKTAPKARPNGVTAPIPLVSASVPLMAAARRTALSKPAATKPAVVKVIVRAKPKAATATKAPVAKAASTPAKRK